MKIPFLSRLFQTRASPNNSFWGSAYSFFFGSSSSGKTVNERTALQTTAVYVPAIASGQKLSPLVISAITGWQTGRIEHSNVLTNSIPNRRKSGGFA